MFTARQRECTIFLPSLFKIMVGPLCFLIKLKGGSVAEWLACWTQAQKGLGANRSRDAVG